MIVYLIGTKAQYIKMAPVIRASVEQDLSFVQVMTGQHRETFEDLRKNFDVPRPELNLVNGDEAKDKITLLRWFLAAIKAAFSSQFVALWRRASIIVVHGDTVSALLGAMIGWWFGVPVAHVEAGLRSYNFFHPFPEELIRVMVSRAATIHFCPDKVAADNLKRARVAGEIVDTNGNTLKDSVRLATTMGSELNGSGGGYGVFSMHRQENLFNANRLRRLLDVLTDISRLIPMKFVLHPVTKKRLENLGLINELRTRPGIHLVDRMDFFSFISLIGSATFVATDGGSNQEECAMLGIPCIILREATERPDGLGENAILAGSNHDLIVAFVKQQLSDDKKGQPRLDAATPSATIVSHLKSRIV